MKHLRAILVWGALLPAGAFAQAVRQGPPHIGYAFPAGAQQGSHVTVTVGGEGLDAPDSAWFSGDGIEAKVVSYFKPLRPGEAAALRDRIKELTDRKAAYQRSLRQASSGPTTSPATKLTWTADDDRTLGQLLQKITAFRPKIPNPAIAETVTLEVTVAPGAKTGSRELRLVSQGGMTNPITFQVGALPELQEQESTSAALPLEVAVRSLPVVINGQIGPGDVDRYRFTAKRAQKLVAAVSARELVPYIADAVPGWFQATVAIYSNDGKQLAFADDFRFKPDPVLCFEPPADGEYLLEIRDSIYRGREDFVYRITLGELPYVTDVFPLGGQAGRPQTVQLTGWNLPPTQITADGVSPLPLPAGTINRPSFAYDRLPDLLEKEPNDSAPSAQVVSLGTIVNGRIAAPGDVDCYAVQLNAGEELIAEVDARRLDSPLDGMLRIVDSSGKTLASNDDSPDASCGLITHQADPKLSLKAPASATYYVELSDTQSKGGEAYAYRLRLSRPMPDFVLIASPGSMSARPGGTVPIGIRVVRRDGFEGEISLSLPDAPGWQLAGGRIPVGTDKIRATITLPYSTSARPVPIHIAGIAKIGGKSVTHEATPAEDMMQAFAYRHLVPVDNMMAYAFGRAAPRMAASVVTPTPVHLHAGGTQRVVISSPQTWWGTIDYSLSDPPEGVTIASTTSAGEETVILLKSDAATTKPFKGNLIIDGYVQPKLPSTRPAAAMAGQRRLALTLPAIPCEISK